MNKIKRILFIIKEMTDDNKLIFVLMIIGLILSNYVMIFFLGNYSAYKNSTLSGYQSLKYPAQNYNDLSYGDILGIDLSEYGVTSCTFSATVKSEDVHMTDGSLITDGYGTKGSFFVNSSSNNEFPVKAFLGNCDISKSDKENVIVLPCTEYTSSLSYDRETGSYGTVEFFGQTLYVIGISTYTNDTIIPYKLYSSTFEPENVSFYVENRLDIKRSDELRDKIYDIFGCSGLVDPYSYYRAAENGYAVLIIIIFIAYLISMLSFVFYIVYFTKRRARSNSIAYICGAEMKRLILETIITNEVIAVLCFVFAAVLNALSSSAFDLFYSVKYDLKDYVIMLLIVMTATLICSVPSVYAMKKSTAAELARNVT